MYYYLAIDVDLMKTGKSPQKWKIGKVLPSLETQYNLDCFLNNPLSLTAKGNASTSKNRSCLSEHISYSMISCFYFS